MGLAEVVCAPSDDGRVGFQCQAMHGTDGRNHVRQTAGHVHLEAVVAPGDNGRIGFQCQAMRRACGHRDHIR